MADIPSRSFNLWELFHAQSDLETYFNLNFPLPQAQSWREYKVVKKLAELMISYLGGKPLPMASLHKLTKLGESIGKTGRSTSHSAMYRLISTRYLPADTASSLPISQQESGPGIAVLEIRSKFNMSRMHSRKSPIPTNWLEKRIMFTKQR